MGLASGFSGVEWGCCWHIWWCTTSISFIRGYPITSDTRFWDPKTYLFDTIPNTMERRDVAVIVSIAILSSVLGALVPAIRAARMNPVEALRWE